MPSSVHPVHPSGASGPAPLGPAATAIVLPTVPNHPWPRLIGSMAYVTPVPVQTGLVWSRKEFSRPVHLRWELRAERMNEAPWWSFHGPSFKALGALKNGRVTGNPNENGWRLLNQASSSQRI